MTQKAMSLWLKTILAQRCDTIHNLLVLKHGHPKKGQKIGFKITLDKSKIPLTQAEETSKQGLNRVFDVYQNTLDYVREVYNAEIRNKFNDKHLREAANTLYILGEPVETSTHITFKIKTYL